MNTPPIKSSVLPRTVMQCRLFLRPTCTLTAQLIHTQLLHSTSKCHQVHSIASHLQIVEVKAICSKYTCRKFSSQLNVLDLKKVGPVLLFVCENERIKELKFVTVCICPSHPLSMFSMSVISSRTPSLFHLRTKHPPSCKTFWYPNTCREVLTKIQPTLVERTGTIPMPFVSKNLLLFSPLRHCLLN